MRSLSILDIQMPNINGKDIAKKIRQKNMNAMIIFLSSFSKYVFEGYELGIFRYILKKNVYEMLPKALNDAIKIVKMEEKEKYIIQTKTRFETIYLKDIIYIYRESKDGIFVTRNGNIKFRKSLTEIYHDLNELEFVFINRGEIVNIYYILKLDGDMVIMKNGVKLFISQSHLKNVKKSINEYWSKIL